MTLTEYDGWGSLMPAPTMLVYTRCACGVRIARVSTAQHMQHVRIVCTWHRGSTERPGRTSWPARQGVSGAGPNPDPYPAGYKYGWPGDFRIWPQFLRRAGYLCVPITDYPDLRGLPCRTHTVSMQNLCEAIVS